YTLLLVNEGELRFYVFIAILCGFAAYQSLLKSIYSRTLEHIIQAIIRLYEFLLRTGELLIVRPLKMLYQLVIVILLGIVNVLLVFGRILLKICWMILKIGFAPIKWIGILIWRLLPTAVTKNVEKIFSKCAGFLKKVE